MINSQEKQDQFFQGLASLPIVQEFIVNYTKEIVTATNSPKKESELVKNKVEELLIKLESYDGFGEIDTSIIKILLYSLFERQLPLTKMAEKIRLLKGSSPSAFL